MNTNTIVTTGAALHEANLVSALHSAIDHMPTSELLAVLVPLVAMLAEAITAESGGDPTGNILITGTQPTDRSITIHTVDSE